MILTGFEIDAAKIVNNASPASFRQTTYDATVGQILSEGKRIRDESFSLPPRGIVWIVSNETFSLPDGITGLATLKTGWTHEGVLALNVGIIDPGWSGPLSTAIVNFSKTAFTINKNDPFLRILFLEHKQSPKFEKIEKDYNRYVFDTTNRTNKFAATFLDFEELIPNISSEIFKMPRLAVWLTYAALLVSFSAIFSGMFWDIYFAPKDLQQRIMQIEQKLDSLCEAKTSPKCS